jgi:glycogen debranching enzyme
MARLASALGRGDAGRFEQAADALRERFLERFWCERLGMYALALDGDKRMCEVASSNAGHALFSGIASEAHAAALARTLLSGEMFSGWGVRTLGSSAARYNPMSYHNGSVWPHDDALLAWGLSRYGFMQGAVRILEGLFDASRYFENGRLPELFCGFARQANEGPTLYPVACSPQAWSAAAPFLLVQAVLGLHIDAQAKQIRFVQPCLPEFLSELTLRDLKVGEHCVDLRLERLGGSTGLTVLRRGGPVHVIVES